MQPIYHITTRYQASVAEKRGVYVPDAYPADGFIHCSYVHQIVWVANQRFRGVEGLVLLEIERTRLSCRVVDENLEGGEELFPHIYGHLPMDAVVRVHPFPCGVQGIFDLPEQLLLGNSSELHP